VRSYLVAEGVFFDRAEVFDTRRVVTARLCTINRGMLGYQSSVSTYPWENDVHAPRVAPSWGTRYQSWRNLPSFRLDRLELILASAAKLPLVRHHITSALSLLL
jgi:hypothetical protein